MLLGFMGLGCGPHCSSGGGGRIRLRDLAFERYRSLPREWTQVDVERSDAERCPKRSRVVPSTIFHCFPDLTPHFCFHHQAAPT